MAETPKQDAEFLEQFEPDVFWQQHGRKIIIGVAGVLAIGLVAIYSQKQSAARDEEAATRLAQATDVTALGQLAREFNGREAGAQALLRLADAEYNAARYPEANAAYQEFLTAYPNHSLAGAARLGQATLLEAQGNLDGARQQYLQLAAAKANYTAVAAKVGAARCTEALGQTKEALQLYEELLPVTVGTAWEVPVAVRWSVLARNKPAPPVPSVPLDLAPPASGQ